MKFLKFFFSVLLMSTVVFSCVDRDFDEPPFPEVEQIDINTSDIISINELKALRTGSQLVAVEMDKYIKGVVVGDDQSGNIYKSLIIQDETGGINIILDDVELWNRYFVGKEVYVFLKDIWIGDYNNLPQIGFAPVGNSMSRIPAALIPSVLTVGDNVGQPEPQVKTIGSLTSADLNTLIQLDMVEFTSGSVGAPYADSAGPNNVNHYLKDCNGNEIILRSSGFSSFVDELTPAGSGSIVAVLGIFGNDYQLAIRDTDDVQLNGERCDGTGGGGPMTGTIDAEKIISVSDVLGRRVEGEEVAIASDNYIKGQVISSDETGNFYKTLVVQDETGGISVLVNAFDIYQDFELGTVVYVHLQDLYVSEFNGLPQLGYVPSTETVKRIPESKVFTTIIASSESKSLLAPTVAITDLTEANLNTYITISGVEFSDSDIPGSFATSGGGGKDMTLINCNGASLILRTSDFSDFADDAVPNGNGSVRGVMRFYQDKYQFVINYPEDVQFNGLRCDGSDGGGTGTGTGTGSDVFSIDFSAQSDRDIFAAEGWTNIGTKGERQWQKRDFQGNGYAQMTAFNDDASETEAWLISPIINTSERGSLNFSSSNAFYKHDGLEVLYSSDFSGNVNSANWSPVSATIAGSSTGDNNWIDSGNVDLSSLGPNIHIAFVYKGTASSNTTTYRIDDIVIE